MSNRTEGIESMKKVFAKEAVARKSLRLIVFLQKSIALKNAS